MLQLARTAVKRSLPLPCAGASRGLARGARGHGWLKRWQEDGAAAFAKCAPPTPFDFEAGGAAADRTTCWLEFEADGEPAGRCRIELASDVLPATSANFAALCAEGAGAGGYASSPVHFIEKGVGLAAGGVVRDGVGDHLRHRKAAASGDGGDLKRVSHAAGDAMYLEDEGFPIPHSEGGLVTMVNSGVDRNGSYFMLTVGPAPHLDGRCVSFGRIVEGLDVVQKIHDGTFTSRGVPAADLRVVACGVE
jgi:cyclophilin family peptidyl-prolyl cis-trans isomerase